MNKYGINNVVGGFGKAMCAEEALPYALARTYLEHRQLREIFGEILHKDEKLYFNRSIELACGYGRNLGLLNEFTTGPVVGVERDQELFQMARRLNPTAIVENLSVEHYDNISSAAFDLVMTFTFMQHLDEKDAQTVADHIDRITSKGGYAVICEETDLKKSQAGCWSRSIDHYCRLLKGFNFVDSAARMIEATFPGRISGDFIIFRKAGL